MCFFTVPSTLTLIFPEVVYLMNLTARPRSAMQHVPFFFTRMFLLLRSRWAMAGLPCVPKISVCRWQSPETAEYARRSSARVSSVVDLR